MVIQSEIPYQIPVMHPDQRIDTLHWMRQHKEEFKKFSEKATLATHEYLRQLQPLVDQLNSEMENQIDLEVPAKHKKVGAYLYFSEFEKKSDYPTFFRKKEGDQQIERLCNWGPKTVLDYVPSPDGKFILFILDELGTQFGDVCLFDCLSHSLIEKEKINNGNGNAAWNRSSDGFWYVKANGLKRSDTVLFHRLNESPSLDTIAYHENDIQRELEIIPAKDSLYLVSSSINNTEIKKIDPSAGRLEMVLPREKNRTIKVIPSPHETYFLFHGEDDKSSLYQLDEKGSLQFIYRSDDFLVNILPLKDYLIFEKREEGLPAFEILNKKTLISKKLTLPLGKTEVAEVDYEHSTFDIVHSSPIHPPAVRRFDCKAHRFLTPFNSPFEGYQIERIFAESNGVKIPITVVRKTALKLNGQNPLLLYAYGSYGSTIDPPFYKPYSSLLERDIIIAYAHVRGGGEYGSGWHKSAKGIHKMTTFNDLIACATHLVNQGYTSSKCMALQGGSAGGTLAAGIINMRPDLFSVVLLEMPFVDALTDLNDPTVPFTPQEWEEWGNPKNPLEYRAIKEWSPLDNVKPGIQPAAYIVAGENDVQVLSDEPYRFWVKLKQNQKGSNPILFEMLKGGHKGDLGRYSSLRQIAPMYAFLLDQFGIKR